MKRVVVVDDDKQILENLVEVLGAMGYEAIPFNCPKLALSMAKQSDIYMVLIDFHMKDMTGAEFIIELKKFRPLVECMVMTADGYRQTIIDSMRAGAADFIRKPFDLQDLEDMLAQAVRRLKAIRKLCEAERHEIKKALAMCGTDKEAAEKLGINYTTLYRKKKAA